MTDSTASVPGEAVPLRVAVDLNRCQGYPGLVIVRHPHHRKGL